MLRQMGGNVGSWEFTGDEIKPFPGEWQTTRWLSITSPGLNVGNNLYMIYGGMKCTAEDCLNYYGPDGQLWLYRISGLNSDIHSWEHTRTPLTSAPKSIGSRSSMRRRFGFHLHLWPWATPIPQRWPPPGSRLCLRCSGQTQYFRRLFHLGVLALVLGWYGTKPARKVVAQINANSIRPIANYVTQEFSVNKLTINGVTRWVLVHSYWVTRELEGVLWPNEKGELVPIQGVYSYWGIGVLRVSTTNSLTTLQLRRGLPLGMRKGRGSGLHAHYTGRNRGRRGEEVRRRFQRLQHSF